MTETKPSIASQVKFQALTVMAKLSVNKRMAQIAAPYQWEELPGEGRGLIRQIATLEQVLTNAPAQFWTRDEMNKPYISIVRDPANDQDTPPSEDDIREAYNAYLDWEAKRFRGGTEPLGNTALQSGGADGLAGGTGDQQEPA